MDHDAQVNDACICSMPAYPHLGEETRCDVYLLLVYMHAVTYMPIHPNSMTSLLHKTTHND